MNNSTAEQQTEESQQIEIWKCIDEICNAWSRVEFVKEAAPSCPLCKNSMILGHMPSPPVSNRVRRTFIIGKKYR